MRGLRRERFEGDGWDDGGGRILGLEWLMGGNRRGIGGLELLLRCDDWWKGNGSLCCES